MNFHHIILFNLLLAIGLVVVTWVIPIRQTWARFAAVALLAGFTLNYFRWRISFLPQFDVTFGAIWPWTFFLFESVTVAYEMWSSLMMVRISNHTPEADRYEPILRARADLPTVDVFIATYSEPLSILRSTIIAAKNLDYPPHLLSVYVNDDGDRKDLEILAKNLGAEYLARPVVDRANGSVKRLGGPAKAGNDRHAFSKSTGAIILLLDADHCLHPNFFYRSLGFLLYRTDIGLVQVPQRYRTSDIVAHNLGAADAVPEEQHSFMTITQSCRDAWGNAFCTGTGCIAPRSILRQLDPVWGFPKETICEDLELSYKILAVTGRRTLYLNEALAFGLAPESISAYLNQRIRWCAGTLQHLFIPTGPIRGPYKWADRLFYADGTLYWLGYIFVALLLLAPAIFWLSGVPAIPGNSDEASEVLLPRLVSRAILTYWLAEGTIAPLMINVGKLLPAFHLTATIVKTILSPWSAVFNVTNKGSARDRVEIGWPMFLGFLTLGTVISGGMATHLLGRSNIGVGSDMIEFNVAWSLFSIFMCVLCALACVEQPCTDDGENREVPRARPLRIVLALAKRLLGLR